MGREGVLRNRKITNGGKWLNLKQIESSHNYYSANLGMANNGLKPPPGEKEESRFKQIQINVRRNHFLTCEGNPIYTNTQRDF